MRTIASIMFVIDEVRIFAVHNKKFKTLMDFFSGTFLADCNLCAGASIQSRYSTESYSTKVFSGINTITVSIVCLFLPILVTGANIYLIGGVVCIVCVFYTLVVSKSVFKSFGDVSLNCQFIFREELKLWF